jgi:hypothetical protein
MSSRCRPGVKPLPLPLVSAISLHPSGSHRVTVSCRPRLVPREGPFVPREGPLIPREGPFVPREGPLVPREGPFVPREGPLVPREGPLVPREGPFIPREGTCPGVQQGRGAGWGGGAWGSCTRRRQQRGYTLKVSFVSDCWGAAAAGGGYTLKVSFVSDCWGAAAQRIDDSAEQLHADPRGGWRRRTPHSSPRVVAQSSVPTHSPGTTTMFRV